MAVGETRNVQVRLENSLPLRAGDHVVVLSYSPVMLIGGGRVLLSRCRRSRELAEGERALYAAIESGDIAGGVGAWLVLQTLPVTAVDVAAALDLGVGEVDTALRVLVAKGAARALAGSDGSLYADASVLDAAMNALAATLSAMHAAAPKETGFTPGAVAHAAWPAADEAVAAALIAEAARVACAPPRAPRYSIRIRPPRRHAWCERLASASSRCLTRPAWMHRRFPRWANSCSSAATP